MGQLVYEIQEMLPICRVYLRLSGFPHSRPSSAGARMRVCLSVDSRSFGPVHLLFSFSCALSTASKVL
jgi:hypothetical protein